MGVNRCEPMEYFKKNVSLGGYYRPLKRIRKRIHIRRIGI